MDIRRFARFAAWIGSAFIVIVTMSPIDARPSDVTTTDIDRALAFIAISGLFVIAYPKRVLAVSIAVLLAAFVLELTQFASFSRHPHVYDAVVKAVGAIFGIGGGLLCNLVLSRISGARLERP